MQFPTSDKIILRAANRLAILTTQDHNGQDPWEDQKNLKMIEAFDAFLLSCSECELRRIVAISNVCLDYAYETLSTVFYNGSVGFPFNAPSDLGKDPRQLSLSI